MIPKEFKDTWAKMGGTLTPLTVDVLSSLNLKSDSMNFLSQAGLPVDAAPFLSFIDNSDNKHKGVSRLTDQYDFLGDEFRRWIVIGSCDNGDPVAIDLDSDDTIFWLDHENDFKPGFFNSSISALAASLVIYRDFVNDVLKNNGPDAFLNGNFSDSQFESVKAGLLKADDKVLSENSFWREQLNTDLALRADYRKGLANED